MEEIITDSRYAGRSYFEINIDENDLKKDFGEIMSLIKENDDVVNVKYKNDCRFAVLISHSYFQSLRNFAESYPDLYQSSQRLFNRNGGLTFDMERSIDRIRIFIDSLSYFSNGIPNKYAFPINSFLELKNSSEDILIPRLLIYIRMKYRSADVTNAKTMTVWAVLVEAKILWIKTVTKS